MIVDGNRTIASLNELSRLAADSMEASVALIAEDLAAAYNAYAKETGATWSVINSNLTYNIDKIMPGLKVVVGEFYELIGAKIYEASTNAGYAKPKSLSILGPGNTTRSDLTMP